MAIYNAPKVPNFNFEIAKENDNDNNKKTTANYSLKSYSNNHLNSNPFDGTEDFDASIFASSDNNEIFKNKRDIVDSMPEYIANNSISSTNYENLLSEDSIDLDSFSLVNNDSLTVEEKLQYIDDFLSIFESGYDECKDDYEKYIDGIPLEGYEDVFSDFNNILLILGIYDKVGCKSFSSYTETNDLAPDIWGRIGNFCKDNEVIESLINYINGISWEESGMANITKEKGTEYGESFENAFLAQYADYLFMDDKIDDEDVRKLYSDCLKNGDYTPLKDFLISQMKNQDFSKMFNDIDNMAIEEINIRSDMAIMNNSIYNLTQFRKLLPFLENCYDSDYLKYKNIDYTDGYGELNDELLGLLSQEEVALYAFLYDKDVNKANEYINAMSDMINQRKGMLEAIKFIQSMNDNGAGVEDFFISGGDGFIDGLYDFGEGFYNLLYSDGIKSEHDYEVMYKTLLLSQSNEYNDLIPDWYRSILKDNYNFMSSVGSMAIPSLLSFVPVGGKYVGSILNALTTGLSACGNGLENAKQEGNGIVESYLYGLWSGLSATVTKGFISNIPLLSEVQKNFLNECVNNELEGKINDVLNSCVKNLLLNDNHDVSEIFASS